MQNLQRKEGCGGDEHGGRHRHGGGGGRREGERIRGGRVGSRVGAAVSGLGRALGGGGGGAALLRDELVLLDLGRGIDFERDGGLGALHATLLACGGPGDNPVGGEGTV
eukprot:367876_1